SSLRNLKSLFDAHSAIASSYARWTVKPRIGRYFLEEVFARSRWSLEEASPFENRRILEPAVNRPLIRNVLRKLGQTIPAFRRVAVKDAWGGILCTLPDHRGAVGALEQLPGLVVAGGFPEGLTLAPAIGTVVADIITGRASEIDLTSYAPERY